MVRSHPRNIVGLLGVTAVVNLSLGMFLAGWIDRGTIAQNQDAIEAVHREIATARQGTQQLLETFTTQLQGLQKALQGQEQLIAELTSPLQSAIAQLTHVIEDGLSPEAVDRAALLARVRKLEAEE